MPKKVMTLWPNETRDLIYVIGANHRQLNPAIVCAKKIDHSGPSGHNMEMNVGVAQLPDRHPTIQLVVGHLAEVLSPCPDSKHGQVT